MSVSKCLVGTKKCEIIFRFLLTLISVSNHWIVKHSLCSLHVKWWQQKCIYYHILYDSIYIQRVFFFGLFRSCCVTFVCNNWLNTFLRLFVDSQYLGLSNRRQRVRRIKLRVCFIWDGVNRKHSKRYLLKLFLTCAFSSSFGHKMKTKARKFDHSS